VIRVIIESPFAGNVWRRFLNRRYARLALRDCLLRGEAPLASHLLYPQALRDDVPADRQLGMEAGFAWGGVAERVVVYVDYGISPGMQTGIQRYRAAGLAVEYRRLLTK
jgi:hypothetical protein